jgi:hypothetical protein
MGLPEWKIPVVICANVYEVLAWGQHLCLRALQLSGGGRKQRLTMTSATAVETAVLGYWLACSVCQALHNPLCA